MAEQKYVSRIIVLGDPSVGKTMFVSRFKSKFLIKPETMGRVTKSVIDTKKGNVEVQIMDSGGGEKEQKEGISRVIGCLGIFIIIDVTSQRSVENINNWMKVLEKNLPIGSKRIMIGNKTDLKDNIIVQRKDIEEKIRGYDFKYLEGSLLFKSDDIMCNEIMEQFFQKICSNAFKTCQFDFETIFSSKKHIIDTSYLLLSESDDSVLGTGAFGNVIRAFDSKNQKIVAIKRFSFDKIDYKKVCALFHEVFIMSKIHNMFLVNLIGFSSVYPYYLVMELVQNGSLFEHLHGRKHPLWLTNTRKTVIALGIACGMIYIHNNSIIHGDLKSNNILIDDNYYPKICDFGIARFVDQKGDSEIPSGTPCWMAPEMLKGEQYGKEVDVYSFAMILYEMLTYEIPFKGKNSFEIMRIVCSKNERPKLPSNTNKNLANLIKRCWDIDPSSRPSFKEIYNLFLLHEVEFNDTDKNFVDAVIKSIGLEVYQDDSKLSDIQTNENQDIHIEPANNNLQLKRSSSSYNNIDINSQECLDKYRKSKKNELGETNSLNVIPQLEIAKKSTRYFHSNYLTSFNSADFNSETSSSDDSSSYLTGKAFCSLKNTPNQTFNTNGFHQIQPPPEVFPFNKNLAIHSRHRASYSLSESVHNQFINQLRNANSQSFPKNIILATERITPKNATAFFEIMSEHLMATNISNDTLLIILKSIGRIIKDGKICKKFVDTNIQTILPLQNEELVDSCLSILKTIVNQYPNSINTKVCQNILLVLPTRTKKVLELATEYARDFVNIENPWPLLDSILINYSSITKHKCLFVKLYYHLCKYYPVYRKARFTRCDKTIKSFLNSSNLKTLVACYNFLNYFNSNISHVEISYIIMHLKSPEINLLAAKYISILSSNSFNMNLLYNLIPILFHIAKTNIIGNEALCNLATAKNAWVIFMKYFDQLQNPLPEYSNTFNLFLKLAENQDALSKLWDSNSSILLFLNYLSENTFDSLNNILSALLTLIVPEKVVLEFGKNGFDELLYKYSFSEGNENTIVKCLRIFTIFTSFPYVPFYSYLVENVYHAFSKFTNLQIILITLIEKLSSYQQCSQILSNLDCSVFNTKQFQNQYRIILNNIQNYINVK